MAVASPTMIGSNNDGCVVRQNWTCRDGIQNCPKALVNIVDVIEILLPAPLPLMPDGVDIVEMYKGIAGWVSVQMVEQGCQHRSRIQVVVDIDIDLVCAVIRAGHIRRAIGRVV
jgi:hypothetical protein